MNKLLAVLFLLLAITVSCGNESALTQNLSEEERVEIKNTFDRIALREQRYRQDGSTFQNREERLPDKPQEYYKEYTVETPGANNRGARRLVMGRDGEAYYTNDHYNTFTKINPEDYN